MGRTGGMWRRSRRYSPRSRRARMNTRLDLTNAGFTPGTRGGWVCAESTRGTEGRKSVRRGHVPSPRRVCQFRCPPTAEEVVDTTSLSRA
jgi:hypothetical protein